MLSGRQQPLTLIALYCLTLGGADIDVVFMDEQTTVNYWQDFGQLWFSVVILTYCKKEVSLIKAERASQIHGYKSVCKAISSHHLEDIRKTTAAASSVRQRTRFTPHSQTLILSLGSLLKSNQKGLSYSITCIH